ncbi:MAG: TraB/GumN family protein [Thermoplasmatota archaeon]
MADPVAPSPAPATPSPDPPGKLTLIGAGHVFQIGPAIRGAIQALRPDVVFVELDPGRLHALVERSRGNVPPPSGGFVHRKLAGFQEGVAGMYGADVGSEMLAAVEGARDVGARLALIDDPAEQTVARAMREVTWRERARVVGMLVGSGFKALWPANRRRAKAEIEGEIRRYQEDPRAMLDELGRKFPTLHRILIAERDAKMAARIRAQMAGARHGVAILGDGHVNGMEVILRDLRPTVFRLAAVREGRLPKPAPVATGTPASVGFTVQWRDPPQP